MWNMMFDLGLTLTISRKEINIWAVISNVFQLEWPNVVHGFTTKKQGHLKSLDYFGLYKIFIVNKIMWQPSPEKYYKKYKETDIASHIHLILKLNSAHVKYDVWSGPNTDYFQKRNKYLSCYQQCFSTWVAKCCPWVHNKKTRSPEITGLLWLVQNLYCKQDHVTALTWKIL